MRSRLRGAKGLLTRCANGAQIAVAVDGSPVSGVLVRWAAQTLLRTSDSVCLLHAPAGMDEVHTLAATGQLVDCEAILQRFIQARPSRCCLLLGSSI